MEKRLTRKDLILIGIGLLLLLLAVWYQLENADRAFPEHTIDFQINRAESGTQSARFLKDIGFSMDGFRHATAFSYDQTAKTFLEKEVGLSAFDELLDEHLCLWYWSNRWFKPLSKEEYRAHITPTGDIQYFEHIVAEEKGAPSLSIDEARRKSQVFLEELLGVRISDWEFVDQKTEVMPNRVDYLFSYKKKDYEIYDATYRFDIKVQGDEIGQFRKYLKVPDVWKREYSRLRSLNNTTATVADIFFLLLIIAAVVVLILRISRRDIRLRVALALGIITFGLYFLFQLNQLPVLLYRFDTNQSIGNFYTVNILVGFLQAVLIGLLVTLVVAAGDALYRSRYPRKMSLPHVFSMRGLRSKEAFLGIFVGLVLAWVFIAFQTFFYLMAKRLGAWAPHAISYSDSLNTAIPWIFVLLGGFVPAVLEEFSFRIFAIPFFERLLKSRVIAVILPAIIWGFAHANYPNQPFWIRGVEVGLIGMVIGVIFLRFNILALLVWHYSVDAIMAATVLVKTGQPYHVISGVLAAGLMVIPLLYGLIYYIRRGAFEESEPLQNAEQAENVIPPPAAAAPSSVAVDYTALPRRRCRLGIALMVLFLLMQFLPVRRIGEFIEYRIGSSEARVLAQEFLVQSGVDPGAYRVAQDLESQLKSQWGKYILQRESIPGFNKLLARHMPNAAMWQVRFYRPLQKEEYRIGVAVNSGDIVAFEHVLADSARGYSIDVVSAQHRVEEFIARRGFRIEDLELKETFSKQMENRRDHTFLWETRPDHPASIDKGRLRIKTVVKGDEIAHFQRSYMVPEEWERRESRRTSWDSARLGIQILGALGLCALFIWILVKRSNGLKLHWKPALITGFCVALLLLGVDLLGLSQLQMQYDTSWSLQVWRIMTLALLVLKLIGIGLLATLFMLLIYSFFPDALGSLRSSRRSLYSRDALFAAAVLTAGVFGVQRLGLFVFALFPAGIIQAAVSLPEYLASAQPFLSSLLSIGVRSVLAVAFIGMAVLAHQKLPIPGRLRFPAVLVLVLLFLPQSVDSVVELWTHFLSHGLLIGGLWIGVRYFLRKNYPAYLYSVIAILSIDRIVDFVRYNPPLGRLYAALLAGLLLASILWLLTEHRLEKTGQKNIFGSGTE